MSTRKFEDLHRDDLGHIREFRLYLNGRSAPLHLIMDDETTIILDLEMSRPGYMYRTALATIVKLHMLWVGQKFEYYEDGVNYLAWRRV